MLKLIETHLLDILPPNLASDPIISIAAKAIDAELTAVTQLSRTVLILARIDELPEDVIDLLAKQFKVDFYDANTPVERKRELVRTSIAWHRIKGTPDAVQQVSIRSSTGQRYRNTGNTAASRTFSKWAILRAHLYRVRQSMPQSERFTSQKIRGRTWTGLPLYAGLRWRRDLVPLLMCISVYR